MKCIAITLALFVAASAHAENITFIYTGVGEGRLNNVPFSLSDFTITAQADTSARESFGAGFSIKHAAVTISIAGLGNAIPLVNTRTLVNNTSDLGAGTVAFARTPIDGDLLFVGPSGGGLGTWDMTTSIGPIAGPGQLLEWAFGTAFVTDRGVLFFQSAFDVPTTFQAIVPAPSAAALLGMGGMLAARRRR